MTNKVRSKQKPAGLRQRAEAQQPSVAAPTNELTAEEARALVQELRIHQTELELQNEQLRSTQEELEEARRELEDLYEAAPVGYISMGRLGRILTVNQTFMYMLDVSKEKLENNQIHRFVLESDHSVLFDHLGRLFDTQATQRCELVLMRSDGEMFDALLESMLVRDPHENVISRTVVSDISARKRAELGQRQADAIVEATDQGLLVVDLEGWVVRINQAMTWMTGLSAESLRGRNMDDLLSSAEIDEGDDPLSHLRDHSHWTGELRCKREDGSTFPARVSFNTLRDQRQRPTHYAGLLVDITQTRREQEQIVHQAYHDAVTGLANRSLFLERLARATREAHRHGTYMALLFLDLDSFKQVNDQLGHEAGDSVLAEFAQRLLLCVRENDTVARLGGDEFALVLVDIEEPRSAATVANKILEALAEPVHTHGAELHVTTSIGIALYPGDSEELESLRRYADIAMYRAKAAGCNCYRFYSQDVPGEGSRSIDLNQDLDSALERDEFLLHYQPILCTATGQLVGMEALVRWQHPHQGMLLPERFLNRFEQTGQIRPLGYWVFRAACHEMTQFPSTEPFVSINVSMRQLHFRESLEGIRKLLRETGFPMDRTVIEITESLPVDGTGSGLETLLELRREGVRLALDDFGTGYSALDYLTRFPIDMIKIDQAFVRQVEDNEAAAQVVDSLIAMAHGLHIELVAEGVETQGQLDFLREHGCDYVQGFFFGSPLPMENMRTWLEAPVS